MKLSKHPSASIYIYSIKDYPPLIYITKWNSNKSFWFTHFWPITNYLHFERKR